ncbi:hypothetical protein DEO72_LG3g2592 [Vigna unguiculata]|uniref:Uncharacterized protein n=1 Tax=Vigna unguiculata TaxID=3917 RepID=A0A4D6LHD4_VIGUN|nr:hypothetical protein DEO72_LG3g2592 [Vigna unguiculata]
MNCRQATHPILLVFWVPERNRLVVSFVPPGDARQINPIVGFCLNCLAVINTRQATRANFGSDYKETSTVPILIQCLAVVLDRQAIATASEGFGTSAPGGEALVMLQRRVVGVP